jgi:hypothetical protein
MNMWVASVSPSEAVIAGGADAPYPWIGVVTVVVPA